MTMLLPDVHEGKIFPVTLGPSIHPQKTVQVLGHAHTSFPTLGFLDVFDQYFASRNILCMVGVQEQSRDRTLAILCRAWTL